jgi:hypothetical protein
MSMTRLGARIAWNRENKPNQSINQSINQSNQPTAPARNDDRKVIWWWWWYAWYTDTSRRGYMGILDQVVSKREKDTENTVMINGLPTYSHIASEIRTLQTDKISSDLGPRLSQSSEVGMQTSRTTAQRGHHDDANPSTTPGRLYRVRRAGRSYGRATGTKSIGQ